MYERATRGELGAFDVANDPTLAEHDPDQAAWQLALRALRARYTGQGEATSEQLRALAHGSAEARLGAAYAAAESLRCAALRFDLAAIESMASALVAVAPPGEAAALECAAAELWCAIARASWTRAAELAGPLEVRAAAAGVAALVVEAAALHALALAGCGLLEDALRIARRASRMARTEALPQVEYLAHWVLARVRRLAGAPHLATRILASLRGVAPEAWWPLLAWELVLSGGAGEMRGPAAVLLDWVLGLERGDGAGFEARTTRLLEATRWPAHRAEVDDWIAAVDPSRPPTAAIARWCGGQTALAPPALSGLLAWRGVAPGGDSAVAYVLVDGAIRRRIPRLSFALIDGRRVVAEAQSRLKQGRTEMLAAALALAPAEGLDEQACFASVYGFPYEAEVHKGVFDVLLHRAREHLADRATITRGAGVLRLTLRGPLLAADPRCTRPLGDALLGALAEHAGASAKEIAKTTGLSLRIVQAALQSLVKDGACQQAKVGREVHYAVEDTTYSEPTQRARLSWSP